MSGKKRCKEKMSGEERLKEKRSGEKRHRVAVTCGTAQDEFYLKTGTIRETGQHGGKTSGQGVKRPNEEPHGGKMDKSKGLESKYQKRRRESEKRGAQEQQKKKKKKRKHHDDGQRKNINLCRKRKWRKEDFAMDPETKTEKKTRVAIEDCHCTDEQDRPPGGSSISPACPGDRTSVSIERFTFQRKIGQGSFGNVLLAYDTTAKTQLAIKVLQKRELQDEDVRTAICVERRVLQEATGNNFLIRGICAFQTEDLLFLGMQYAHGGDLDELLHKRDHLDIKTATFYGAEIVSGLQYLHLKGFIHRDIKPENILIDGAGHIKVADFGLALNNVHGDMKATGYAGTRGYVAPEILCNHEYDAGADWFSFGVVLFQMLTGDSQFNISLLGVEDYSITTEAENIIAKLLSKDPARRLGADGMIRYHPFFRSIDWVKLEALQLEPPFIPGKPSEESFPHLTLQQLMPTAGSAWDWEISSFNQEHFRGFSFENI